MDYEEFESLDAENQARVFAQSSLRDKGELILRSHDPMKLARSVSGEEFYLMTREMDVDERGEVLRYASRGQLVFVSDIDCWHGDTLKPEGFVRWLQTLLEAGEEKLLEWLTDADYEVLVTGFKKCVHVVKPDHEYPMDEILGDRPYFTIDQRYYIWVQEQSQETLKRVIEICYEHRQKRYVAVLEGIIGEMDYEVEEDAYRYREIRLQERGFPDDETARKIYQPFSQEDFEKFPRKARFEEAEPRDLPHYPALWQWDRLFLDEALLVLGGRQPDLLEGIQEEMTWLSNKIIVCHGMDFTSEDKVRRGVARMRSLLSFALENLSGGCLEKASVLLAERWLEAVFRYGTGIIFGLQREARETLKMYWQGESQRFLTFLDPPYEFIWRGVLGFPPQFYDREASGDPDFLRDFRTPAEAGMSEKALRQIKAVLGFLRRDFPGDFRFWLAAAEEGDGAVTLFKILGNLYAHFASGRRLSLKPLSAGEFSVFCGKAFRPGGKHRVLDPESKARFMESRFTAPNRELLLPLWGLVFQNIQDELGRLKTGAEFRPEFLGCFCFEPLSPCAEIPKAAVKNPAKAAGRPKARRASRG